MQTDWPVAFAFAHPVWMVASLAMALATARMGLEIRRRRSRGEAPGRALRARHLRVGRIAVAMVVIGFALGPPSMVFVRAEAGFETFHGILGVVVVGLYLWTGWSGRALARGDQQARDVHRIAAAGAIGASLLSAVAGFTLLP